MLARSAFRAARSPVHQTVRLNSTKSSGGSGNTALLAGVVLAAGAGGYYYLQTQGAPAPLAKGPPSGSTFTGGKQGWIPLTLKEVEDVNHNTKKFVFDLPKETEVSGLKIASAILTKLEKEGEKPVIRPYTPISDEEVQGFLTLLVKKYEGGPMSSHFHDLKPNDKLEFKGPISKYPWSANKHNHIALVCGGTGITPMYQLIRAIFNNPEDKTKVTLLFANVSPNDILLKKELDDLANKYPRQFEAVYLVDKADKSWSGETGFITKELLKKHLPEPKNDNAKVFVCGPPPMYKAISGGKKSPSDQGELTGYLKELGYDKEQVFKF